MPCALAKKIIVAARKKAKAAIDGACIQVALAQREVHAANKRAHDMEMKANTKIKGAKVEFLPRTMTSDISLHMAIMFVNSFLSVFRSH